jgi:hypothetical protein
MAKKKVLVSFDFDNDRALKDFIIGQSKLPDSPFVTTVRSETLILLLCGGDKRIQARDIEKPHDYWKDYKARKSAVPSGGPSNKPG